MQSIFQPMAVLLPLSFDETVFEAAPNRATIEAQLLLLSKHVNDLEAHARHEDRAFGYVAKSLGRDARAAYQWYRDGAYDRARFTLHNMTENCIECHSSLPETTKYPGSDLFFERVDRARLPKHDEGDDSDA